MGTSPFLSRNLLMMLRQNLEALTKLVPYSELGLLFVGQQAISTPQ